MVDTIRTTDRKSIVRQVLAANKLAYLNRAAIEASEFASCYGCMTTFNAKAKPVTKWVDEGQTALCPYCGIDSVVPVFRGPEWLRLAHDYWFDMETARSLAEDSAPVGRQQPSKLHDAGSNPAGSANLVAQSSLAPHAAAGVGPYTTHSAVATSFPHEPGRKRSDTALLDGLEAATHDGDSPGLINDDNGHWSVTADGMQNVPEGEGPADVHTTFFVEAGKWKPTIREAINDYLDSHAEDMAAFPPTKVTQHD